MAKRSVMVLDMALRADNMRVQMVTGERFAIIDAVSALAAQGERGTTGGGVQVSGASFGSTGAHDSYFPPCSGTRPCCVRGADPARAVAAVGDREEAAVSGAGPGCREGGGGSHEGGAGRVGAAVRKIAERLQVFEELLARRAITQAEHDHHRALLLAGL